MPMSRPPPSGRLLMQAEPLCADGALLTPVVAGCWRLAEWNWNTAQTLQWIEQAVDLGITSFDHADLYGTYAVEALFGQALATAPGLRKRLQIVTKCGIKLHTPARPAHRLKSYDSSAAHIELSVNNSLAALHTDHIDLLLLHRPDWLMDAHDAAQAFERLRRAGKVLHFGVSNFSPAQFELLDAVTPLCTNQIELHPLNRGHVHDGVLDQAQRLGRRPMIWSPLAGGRLIGGDESESARRVRWVMGEIAAKLGVAPATVAYAWALRHPSRPVVITGSRRIEALQQAIAATGFVLDREDWYALWQAATGHDVA
jgi:predicted oxidoreductase